MKKKIILLSIIISLFFQHTYSQQYYSFPTDTAYWNTIMWYNNGTTEWINNYQYIMQGDTVLKGKTYSKIYLKYDNSSIEQYFGGIREDSIKNIYFFPNSICAPAIKQPGFPSDTMECLLYTFNNLDSGSVVPINISNANITVTAVDSVLVGNIFHKRYKISNSNMIHPPEYWIEGVGSTKELFAPYCEETTWELYTLCFEDTASYYINTPNGVDSCHYSLNIGLNEYALQSINIYPNPASDIIHFDFSNKTEFSKNTISIYNIEGKLIQNINVPENTSNISFKVNLENGLYFYRFLSDKEIKAIGKFNIIK